MEDNATKYEFPDFGPDDDTEDMTGVSIYRPEDYDKEEFPDLDLLPELPSELNLDNGCALFKIYQKAS